MLTLSKEEHCARFKQLGRSLEDQIAADAPASVLQLYYNFAMKMFCELEMMDTPEPPWLLPQPELIPVCPCAPTAG
jgi:hypothetical protein